MTTAATAVSKVRHAGRIIRTAKKLRLAAAKTRATSSNNKKRNLTFDNMSTWLKKFKNGKRVMMTKQNIFNFFKGTRVTPSELIKLMNENPDLFTREIKSEFQRIFPSIQIPTNLLPGNRYARRREQPALTTGPNKPPSVSKPIPKTAEQLIKNINSQNTYTMNQRQKLIQKILNGNTRNMETKLKQINSLTRLNQSTKNALKQLVWNKHMTPNTRSYMQRMNNFGKRFMGTLFGSGNKNIPTKIEEILKTNKMSNSDKTSAIKILLNMNDKRTLSNKQLHIIQLNMNPKMKNDILAHLNKSPPPPPPAAAAPPSSSGNGKPSPPPPVVAPVPVPAPVGPTATATGTTIKGINSKDPLKKIAGILALSRNTTGNDAKVESIIQILKDNPSIIRKAHGLIIGSSLGRNSKDELISHISDLLEEERYKARARSKLLTSRNRNRGRYGIFGRGGGRGGELYNNYNNNNYNFSRRMSSGIGGGVGGGGGSNVAFRKTIPVQPYKPSAASVIRSSSGFNGGNRGNRGNGFAGLGGNRGNGNGFGGGNGLGGGLGGGNINRNRGLLNNSLGGNRGNGLGDGLGGGNGLGGGLGGGNGNRGNGLGGNRGNLFGPNQKVNFVNTINYTSSAANANQQKQKKRSRPVRMKLLKETVDNVKKNKLVKQVKKLGKSDGLKVITQKKKNIVKYIVKQIRPPAKKTKKRAQRPPPQPPINIIPLTPAPAPAPAPVKANQQLIFKNTIVGGNGTFQRNGTQLQRNNGTRNQNVRQPNAQNTGVRRNNNRTNPLPP